MSYNYGHLVFQNDNGKLYAITIYGEGNADAVLYGDFDPGPADRRGLPRIPLTYTPGSLEGRHESYLISAPLWNGGQRLHQVLNAT